MLKAYIQNAFVQATMPWTVLLILLATGCSSFQRDWETALQQPRPEASIIGPWEGEWRSDANDHHGRLRCLLSRKGTHVYQARFHAKYWKIFGFSYTAELHGPMADDRFTFEGEEDLGWWAGGTYHYEGSVTPNRFSSSYRSEHDHGTYQMTRPEALSKP